MHDLKPITPLGGTAARVDTVAGLTLRENPDQALASLASRLGREADCAKTAAAFLGCALPGPGQHDAAGLFAAFWTGPEQWMVTAPHDSHEDLAVQIKLAVGDAGSVTEQTDGWCRFELEGAEAPAVLERLCAVDTGRMQGGAATRTIIEHLGCFLICRETGRAFSVLGPRSSARALHHAILTAIRAAL
ncbi:MAG: sarcosine oxidase subunit gamma [Qingshengfaniella sp.]